jgi:glycosyltransferase involved in cell wall biosynthesis
MAPLVSVIIPAYNHEAYIGEAIASVLAQELADFELIVIDDGSTDATAERIQAFDDPRIRFFRQENRGAAATLNRGLELARGRYLAILNSDDRYRPGRLQTLAAALENEPGKRLAVSAVRVIGPEGRPAAAEWLERGLRYYRQSGNLFAAAIRDNFVCTTSNLFLARELLELTGSFLPLRYCHDLDFILQARRHEELLFCDEELLDYRVHETNTIKEIARPGGELFKFEVAAVIACALAVKGIPESEAAIFVEGLLETQFGSLLDLVGLLAGFLAREGEREPRNRLRSWLEDPESPVKPATLGFIAIRDAQNRRPWDLYYEVLRLYEENRESLLALERTNREVWEQSQGFARRVAELNEIVAARDRRISYLENIEATLNEIYRSRGWLWLTRYRRLAIYLRGLVKGREEE